MSYSSLLRRMHALGLTHEQALIALEAIEAERLAENEARRREESAWPATRRAVLRRDGYACFYCGAENSFQCDHVVPRSKGGRSVAENLVASCKTCNSSKKDRTPEEWRGEWA